MALVGSWEGLLELIGARLGWGFWWMGLFAVEGNGKG